MVLYFQAEDENPLKEVPLPDDMRLLDRLQPLFMTITFRLHPHVVRLIQWVSKAFSAILKYVSQQTSLQPTSAGRPSAQYSFP